MNPPLVSIIVPTYNRADLVVETLESIRMQSYRSLELLVIDDGSVDGTVRVVSDWIDQHRSRFASVRLIENSRNKGKSGVVNQGFGLFTGEYVMVFDSDDLLLPETVEKQIHHLDSHPAIDALCGGAYRLSGSEKTEVQFHPLREGPNLENIAQSYGDLFLNGNPVISSTVIMKRSVVEGTGLFSEELRITHDWDYWIRVSRRFVFGFLNVPLIYYRMNSDGSISQNKEKLFRDVVTMIEKYGTEYSRSTMLRMIVRQMHYHLWLAKNDRSRAQFAGIMRRGLWLLLRYSIVGR